jgi:heme-degrading monooxygenase HmoA
MRKDMMSREGRIHHFAAMVAHLVLLQCRPDRCDGFVQAYRDGMLPALQMQLGYRGSYLLVDRVAARVLAVSLWDTVEDARAYDRSAAYQEHLAGADDCLAAPAQTELYEVTVHA